MGPGKDSKHGDILHRVLQAGFRLKIVFFLFLLFFFFFLLSPPATDLTPKAMALAHFRCCGDGVFPQPLGFLQASAGMGSVSWTEMCIQRILWVEQVRGTTTVQILSNGACV